MRSALPVSGCFLALAAAFSATNARADAHGVGLGVAVGMDYYNMKQANSSYQESLSWGYFVDIPLLETFYISPAAMLYQLDAGNGKQAVTDVDLNFKFIVPISRMKLGAGVTAGVTSGLGDYKGHWGALGYFSLDVVSNLEAFVMVQYKQMTSDNNITNIHGYVGGMFRF
jgi:hypothetical protein